MDSLLYGLRAVAEPTRLRLLALCARGEFTVSELTQILGHSQPRVSRHLKLLCDAGVLDRFREGTWVFYRLAERGPGAALSRALVGLVPEDDPTFAGDRQRLASVIEARTEAAAAYFRANAARWDEIRSLYVPESDVEDALLDLCGDDGIGALLDVGTGTGRILELFADKVDRAIGIDLSHEMLAIARTNLERRGLRHCQVRHANMYSLPVPSESVDLVTFHQVLHFADEPAAAVAEAARVLRPGGRVAVVDFLPHELEFLRTEHAHRRLGFADDEVAAWFDANGLVGAPPRHLSGDPLTVGIWPAVKAADAAVEGGPQ